MAGKGLFFTDGVVRHSNGNCETCLLACPLALLFLLLFNFFVIVSKTEHLADHCSSGCLVLLTLLHERSDHGRAGRPRMFYWALRLTSVRVCKHWLQTKSLFRLLVRLCNTAQFRGVQARRCHCRLLCLILFTKLLDDCFVALDDMSHIAGESGLHHKPQMILLTLLR